VLLKDMLHQGSIVPETSYEAKQIICPLGLEVGKKSMRAFYIMGLGMKTLRNALFMDSTDSIIEKMTVMTRTETKTEEKAGLKRCFGTFLSFLV
jgi:hypothetical protein